MLGAMTTTDTLSDPNGVETLTDLELERELTHAALSSYRSARFDLLLEERRRRRDEHVQQIDFSEYA
jgi:hypothetical protein